MRRLYTICLSAIIIGLLCQAQQPRAQLTISGVGGGFGGNAAYAGPLDIVTNWLTWNGLRCAATAYTGNVADVYAPLDASHTLLTCSSGGVLNETIQALATTCAVSCTIKTLFDQSGNTNCGGAACDAANATIATRPTLSLNCIGTKYCMTFSGIQSLTMVGAFGAIGQPFTVSCFTERTGNTSNFATCFGNTGVQLGFADSANNALQYAGSVVTVSASDNAFHAMNSVFNGASSVFYIDGSTNSTNAGAADLNATVGNIGTGNNALTGKITEVGIKATNFSSGVSCGSQSACLGALDSNQRGYWQ